MTTPSDDPERERKLRDYTLNLVKSGLSIPTILDELAKFGVSKEEAIALLRWTTERPSEISTPTKSGEIIAQRQRDRRSGASFLLLAIFTGALTYPSAALYNLVKADSPDNPFAIIFAILSVALGLCTIVVFIVGLFRWFNSYSTEA